MANVLITYDIDKLHDEVKTECANKGLKAEKGFYVFPETTLLGSVAGEKVGTIVENGKQLFLQCVDKVARANKTKITITRLLVSYFWEGKVLQNLVRPQE